LFSITNEVPLRPELNSHVEFECLNASGKSDIVTAANFILRARQERPDILQSFLFFDNNLARLSGLFTNETTVISGVRSVPTDWGPPRSWIDDLTLPLADHIVSNSEAGADWVIDRGADRESVSVIYNGRDIERYANAQASDALYKELKIDASPVVGTVGRLIKRKGHYDLLKAWSKTIESYPSATLLIIGDGPERSGLEKRASQLGCEEMVRFTGFRTDVPELLNLMDLFVFPSHFEGLPGALIEAMAAGLPIVCTPVDGNSELVQDGESGIHVAPHAPDQLSNAMIGLLDDFSTSCKLGANAQARAQEMFSIDTMMAEFDRLYKTIASGK